MFLRLCPRAPRKVTHDLVRLLTASAADFLDDYFLNRADYTGTGATSVQDLFDFLGDFFAGI